MFSWLWNGFFLLCLVILPIGCDRPRLQSSKDETTTVEESHDYGGFVCDDCDLPIEGIEVRVHLLAERWWEEEPLHTVKTDASGRFRFQDLFLQRAVLSAAGERHQKAVIYPALPREDHRLRCARLARVYGKIEDEQTGRPISGVTLRWKQLEGKTDEHGYFSGLLPVGGERVLRLTHPDYLEDSITLSLTDLDDHEGHGSMSQGVTLILKVIDQQSHRPLNEVIAGAHGSTDELGLLKIRARAGSWESVPLHKSGYKKLSLRIRVRPETDSTPRTIPMGRDGDRATALVGSVLDETGQPVVGAAITASKASVDRSFSLSRMTGLDIRAAELLGERVTVYSEVDGTFSVPGLKGFSQGSLIASKEGYVSWRVQDGVIQEPMDIELVRGGTLTGELRENGEPSGEVFLGFYNEVREVEAGQFSGHYILKELPPGDGRIVVFDRRLGRLIDRAVFVQEGETRTLDLSWGDMESSISGQVVDEEGRALKGVEVKAIGDARSMTDQWGRFTLPVSKLSPVDIRFCGPTKGKIENVVPGTHDLRWVCSKPTETYQYALNLVEENGRRAKGSLTVYVRETSSEASESRPFERVSLSRKADGTRAFRSTLDSIDVLVCGLGYRRELVRHLRSAEGPFRITMRPGITLQVEFEAPPPALQGHRLLLISDSGRTEESTASSLGGMKANVWGGITDGLGVIFRGLEPGDYLLKDPQGLWDFSPKSVTLDPSEPLITRVPIVARRR